MSLDLPATSTSSSLIKINKSVTTTASSHVHLTSSSPPSPAPALNSTSNIVRVNSSPVVSKKSSLNLFYPPSFGHQIYPSVKNEYTHSTGIVENFQKYSPQINKKSPSLTHTANNQSNSFVEKSLLSNSKKKNWKKNLSNGNKNIDSCSNLGTKNSLVKKVQCKHCLQYYLPNSLSNKRELNENDQEEEEGVQQQEKELDAEKSDFFLKCINSVTCFGCTQCVLNKCINKKDEENYEPKVKPFCCSLPLSASSTFSCSSSSPTPPSSNTYSSSFTFTRGSNTLSSFNNNNNLNRCKQLKISRKRKKKFRKKETHQCLTKRSIILTVLSFFIPCLICYNPLKSCHKMSQKRKLCSFCCCSENSEVDKEICMARSEGDIIPNGSKFQHSRAIRFHEPM